MEKTASQLIDEKIEELGDWRGNLLSQIRGLILELNPEIVEEWKWRGTPVWSLKGMLCTGETYKSVVKVTFAKGTKISDPTKMFNSSLDGNVRRAIDFHEGEEVDQVAFSNLVKQAIELNK